ncbi:hypothetical protein H0H93_009163 [Arthromyces matolae]|nr:hypothetical protein H0H93_009163 [Arthromyces matolae]
MILKNNLSLCLFTTGYLLSVAISIPIYVGHTPLEDSAAHSYSVLTIARKDFDHDSSLPTSRYTLSRRDLPDTVKGLHDPPPPAQEHAYLIPSESPTKNTGATAIRHQINAAINAGQAPWAGAVLSLRTILTLVDHALKELPIETLKQHEKAPALLKGIALAEGIVLNPIEPDLLKLADEICGLVKHVKKEQIKAKQAKAEQDLITPTKNPDIEARARNLLSQLEERISKLGEELIRINGGANQVKKLMTALIAAEHGQITRRNADSYKQSLLRPLDDYAHMLDITHLNQPYQPNSFNTYILGIVNAVTGK